MLDHLGIRVSDYDRAKAFYSAALAPLGYTLMMEIPPEYTAHGGGAAGFGAQKADFWISFGERPAAVHIAVRAADRAAVHAFHAAALAVGARDNGAPGLRPHYHADYYGAFVLDADGNNIEAVCRTPEHDA